MRLYFTSSLTFSEDESNSPTNIIYQDASRAITDTTTFTQGASGYQTFATSASDVAIPLGQITAGKWIYLVSDGDFTLKIDGAAVALALAGNRPHQLFVDFTSIEIGNPSNSTEINISYTLGGS